MSSTPTSTCSRTDSEAGDALPWDALEHNLKIWLAALQTSISCGEPMKVLVLLEGLVTFVSSNEGVFLHTMMAAENPEKGLKDKGAPASFIATFMDIIRITGGMHGPRIITFGPSNTFTPHLSADLLRRFRAATSPQSSPRAASPRLEPRTTSDMLDDVRLGHGVAQTSAGRTVSALELAHVSDAVVCSVGSLPPAVIEGLEQATAAPFLLFRWLNTCLIEVVFCIYHVDAIMVVKRKIVYVGPKPGSQIEGQLCIGSSSEPLKLDGPYTLPWHEVAGLLEAPQDV